MAVSVYATRCDVHVNRLDICGRFAETPQQHLFFGVNAEKSLCLCGEYFFDAIALVSSALKIFWLKVHIAPQSVTIRRSQHPGRK